MPSFSREGRKTYLTKTALILVACHAASHDSVATVIELSAGDHDRGVTAVSVELPDNVAVPARPVVVDRSGESTAAQLEAGSPRRLWWIAPSMEAGSVVEYRLAAAGNVESPDPLTIQDRNGRLDIAVGGKPVLGYNHAVVPSPDPAQPWYARSGFIHPVTTPAGKIVTDPMPADHLHQHGLMFAWTRSRYRGTPIDFWNEAALEGKVSHAESLATTVGPVFAEIQVLLHHGSLAKTGGPQVILHETWRIRAYAISAPFVWELRSDQQVVGSAPLEIETYHYGGMMIRGAAEWGPSGGFEFLTSERKGRDAGNHTRPRWVDLSGAVETVWAGMTSMGHPDNFRFPQPVRIHPSMPYFCFAPLVIGPFAIEPGKPYTSQFRFVVHDGRVDPARADAWWRDYSDPPQARVAD